MPDYFFDERSDDKGPEPEDLAFGRIEGRRYLFVGLERANGVMAVRRQRARNPSFAAFLGNPPGAGLTARANCRSGWTSCRRRTVRPSKALLLVTNEVSGNTRAFELSAHQ